MDYIKLNRKFWNDKTDIHYESEFYDVKSFLKGNTSLNPIELNLLGNIEGKSILHLQCHFGQDSISLARMGAQVTGVDFSDKAIKKAHELSESTKVNARFIQSDVYELEDNLNETFDIVFTSYGAIGWLPDMKKWASIISKFLKPNGIFIMVEFHPVVWMFDDSFEHIKFSYFNKETIVEEVTGTYTDRQAPIKNTMVSWNHSLSNILNSLIQQGLEIEKIKEFDYSPYNCFENTVKIDHKKYQLKGLEGKIPIIFSLKAIKK